jgi:uncharacterized protein YyaL (SSP411 family)
MNHLAEEKSPYLLQHADNPVDWYPWGEAAFAKAKKENKPIFLSIGYSTCHWCHVMAHESFADPDVARLLNDVFVCIKVDREERPDIDGIYMTVCAMLTGSGGWPLTIVMTPDRKPFFAGTYFPKKTLPGRIGMLELPARIKEIWGTRQQEVVDSAATIVQALLEVVDNHAAGPLTTDIFNRAFDRFAGRFDEQYGGFGPAPKFPAPHNLLFLLRYWKQTGNGQALGMVERTLIAMRQGGMVDHVGFGFHRYSTDQQWLLPHFEKMLYDQAMLALAYTEAFQVTGNPEFRTIVAEIFTYIERVMTHAEGGFYSAEDADSEGEEGKFYVWTAEELQQVLNADDAALTMRVYNITAAGNFREEASNRKTGANILHRVDTIPVLAADLKLTVADLTLRLENIRQVLFAAREKRSHPHKDDKILTDWNGLLIAALAKGARVFDQDEYLATASRAADFILRKMRAESGRLLHRFRDGEAAVEGMLDDYAFLVRGLIELYEASFVPRYLQEALMLTDITLSAFWDREKGGFFQTPADGEELLVRRKDIQDGAIPSGNSIALANLLRLTRMTGRSDLEDKARRMLSTFAAAVEKNPDACTQFLQGVDLVLSPGCEIVIVGDPHTPDTKRMVRAFGRLYAPRAVLLFKDSTDAADNIGGLSKFTENYTTVRGRTTAYVCTDFRCELPTIDIDEAVRRVEDNATRHKSE